MGIPGFIHWLSKDEFRSGVKFKGNFKYPISSLFIDFNGIIHREKTSVYKLDKKKFKDEEREKLKTIDPKKLQSKHIKAIIDKLTEVLEFFKPTDTFILAPDGLVNAAKMQQQKSRRYEYDPEENEIFKGASISPGTDFMIDLDKEIRNWLVDNPILPVKTIYSSHLDPGEGEHKIMDFIRSKSLHSGRGNHIMYGADRDLFILSFLSNLPHIYLFDENKSEFYNIDKMRNIIKDKIAFNGYQGNTLIRDFSLLTFMLGNDFLERLPNFYDLKTSLDVLIEVYKKNAKFLTKDINEIIWPNFLSFLKILKDHRFAGYSNMYEFNFAASFTPFHNKWWKPYPEIAQAVTISDTRGNIITDENYNPSKHTFEFDVNKFAIFWYNKQFKPRCEKLRDMYNKEKYYDSEDIMKMCKYFLKIIQWTLYYYTEGPKKVSDMLFYPFLYSPMLESLINFLEYEINSNGLDFTNNIRYKKDSGLTVIHQLMLIIPPQISEIIPSPFRELYSQKLKCLCPTKFLSMPLEGTETSHHHVTVIPPINPWLALKVVSNSGLKIPSEYLGAQPLIIERVRKSYKKDYKIKQTVEN